MTLPLSNLRVVLKMGSLLGWEHTIPLRAVPMHRFFHNMSQDDGLADHGLANHGLAGKAQARIADGDA